MTLDEQKLAVAGKLAGLIEIQNNNYFWVDAGIITDLNWQTEGLQVCHEAEKLLRQNQFHFVDYPRVLWEVIMPNVPYTGKLGYLGFEYVTATYEQRLGALCRVWWPERFQPK